MTLVASNAPTPIHATEAGVGVFCLLSRRTHAVTASAFVAMVTSMSGPHLLQTNPIDPLAQWRQQRGAHSGGLFVQETR
jgi:hypothetical protein